MVKYTNNEGKIIHTHGGNKPVHPYPKGTSAIFIDEEERRSARKDDEDDE